MNELRGFNRPIPDVDQRTVRAVLRLCEDMKVDPRDVLACELAALVLLMTPGKGSGK